MGLLGSILGGKKSDKRRIFWLDVLALLILTQFVIEYRDIVGDLVPTLLLFFFVGGVIFAIAAKVGFIGEIISIAAIALFLLKNYKSLPINIAYSICVIAGYILLRLLFKKLKLE